nr:hypothetical protein [Tanacetum cinerariifolium]
METLTVETSIPSVSSPIPTACFEDSPEPSSTTRIISKRVTSQDVTPSLDNISTLANRFDDILGVTTTTVDSHGEKADVSNMETTITASPTPTLRIYKDHLKKPKKILDALNDLSWVEAMQEELFQFKIQNVWSLVDCLKGVKPIGTKWVLKNKKDERGIVIRNKARLMAQGHTQEEEIDYDEKKDGIFLSQDKYVGDILKKFAYSDVRSANTPMDKENPWEKTELGKIGCQFLGRRLISWQCKKQKIMATSTTEAEYVAAASGCEQVLWIQNQLLDYGHHFIRDCFEKKLISVDHIHTDNNVVDLLTKPFDVGRFQYLVVEQAMRGYVKGNHVIYTTFPHHTPSPEAQQTSPTTHSSSLLLPVINEPLPTVIPFDTPQLRQYTRRARIAQSSALPPVADEPASPIRDDMIQYQGLLPLLLMRALKVRVKLLEDREGGGIAQSGEDAPIKGRSLDKGEEAAIERSMEKGSNNIEEMVNVLTSLDAATVLSSGVSVIISPVTKVYVAEVPTGSGSIPTDSPPSIGVPTGSDVVPTASPIFTTAIVATPYTRRKGKEKMVESETPKKKKIQEQMDVQMARQLEEEMERDAQRMNEQIARDAEIASIHAEEELPLCKSSQITYSTKKAPLKEATKRVLYVSAQESCRLESKTFKGITLEEIKEKFDPVWKQFQNFIPIGSKQEAERFKRKRPRLEQDSAKKAKTSEEVPEEKLKEMMQLIPVEEVYVEALQVKHPIIDWEVHTKGERSYWKIIRPAANDKEMELWVELKRLYEPDVEDKLWTHTQTMMHDSVEWRLYDSCGVHPVLSKDQEIFMLVEKEYPLRKGLAIVMIINKLQVENYSQMANDLILKIHKITNSRRQQDD